ncbi:phage tail tape measure protein [Fusobacterium varium]|uniref:phage tail tape measure protein n=1 Tax=Fusobacterium varium TaxID=856 RepID=UPI001F1EC43A|nr:phage tail tape measure protein [Fusobacterium varium]MCF2673375.1 phage tail tape measure protein [Fusobacterium varium]
MSDYVLSVALELKDKFSFTIQSAHNKFKNMDNDITSVASSIKTSLKNISATDISGFQKSANSFITKGVLGLVTGGSMLGMVVKSSYMEYADLNEQLTRNSAITGANAKEQEILKNQVSDLGRTTKFTAMEVAKAQMYQAMAGYKTNEILAVTPTLLKLAIATGEDLAATSDMVTDNLSAFGLGVQDAGMFADLLASTANNTNTSVAMLGSAFKYVGTTSVGMKENIREVAVMLGIAADNGIKAEQAGTGLRGIYARLSKLTPEMYKQLEKTNTVLYDEKGNFLGLRKIIEESKPALEKLTAEQRNQWLATIAGTEGMSLWNAIMNNTVEGTKKAEDAVYNSAGALDKFTATMEKTDRQKIDELGSAFDGLKLKIGNALSPTVIEQIEKLTGYINELSDSDKFSTSNMESFFNKLVEYAKVATTSLVTLKITALLVRAAMGDPAAIATLIGIGAGGLAALYMKESTEEKKEERKKWYRSASENFKTPERYNPNDLSGANYGFTRKAEKTPEKVDFLRMKYPDLKENYLDDATTYLPKGKEILKTNNSPFETKKAYDFNIKIDVTGVEGANEEIVKKAVDASMLQITDIFKGLSLKNETEV